MISPVSHYQPAFAEVPGQMVVIGHTHMPFDRLADTRRVINPGSIGLSYGTRHGVGTARTRGDTAAHPL